MKKVKIGIIGIGNMGKSHVKSVSELDNCELVAVCDLKKELADKFASENRKVYYDAYEMIASREVEGVIIATPHYDHTTIAIAALDAGIHVLTEKPVGVHKADVAKMIEAHDRNPELVFAAMFQQRTINAHKKIKQLIENDELGEILRVNWIVTTWFRSQCYYDSGGWRATWKGEGGGVLLNQCPHQLDLFQWFFGMPSKVRAHCTMGKYHNIEVEDDVTAYCEFPNGATGVFITSTGEAPGTNRLEITGDMGKVVYEGGTLKFRRNEQPTSKWCRETESGFGKPDSWNIEIPCNQQGGAHKTIIDNFADAILNGTELIASAREGIRSVELGNSMLLSSLKDKTIEIPMNGEEFEIELKKLIENSKYEKDEIKQTKDNFDKSF